MHDLGIQGQQAPELRVPEWLENTDGPLLLADIEAPLIVLYNFQSWCPGCHSHGFPAIVSLKNDLEVRGLSDRVQFIAVQTVFEGHDENTAQKARESVVRHGLTDIPLGHDSGHPPTIMEDYRTGGTPWTVLIGPDRTVLLNDFHIQAPQVGVVFANMLRQLDLAAEDAER
ncbi:MAG: TlpA family protein disulfide reductase [Acidimicrobiia bacterium]|nr:TlpA family protein disulfide reductase [Acidimicrobiia bacterium]